jgi:nitrile hydratase accessory protein
MSDIDREIADLKGRAALPRKNGELVFNQPWEGRAFGLALALRATRPYRWEAFQEHLEREIAEAGPDPDGSRYYERWVAAVERLLADQGLVSSEELERRVLEYREGLREEVF